MRPCNRCGELHVDDYTTCLEIQIKKYKCALERIHDEREIHKSVTALKKFVYEVLFPRRQE